MTSSERTEYIDKLVTIAYYWLSEDNFNCAETIQKLLSELTLNKKERERVDGLKSDIKTMSISKHAKVEDVNLKIPSQYKTEEEKLLWITVMSLMNLFNVGNFEMGYIYLTEISETWPEVYYNIIPILQKFQFKEELVNWALAHALFAKDIAGKDNLKAYGYKVEKI